MNFQNLTKEQRENFCRQYLTDRQRARTDLFYLCNEVLAPGHSRIMVPHAHRPITEHFQKFKGHKERMDPDTFKIVLSETLCPLWDLADQQRDSMLLVSRGHLKTTIDCGHIIQWIINYPDVRVLIATATGEQNERMLNEVRGHFQFNPRFRFFFPEFCPPAKKAADFGSSSEFTVPNRSYKLKEPTVMTASVGKVIASTHHEVIKADDVVTEGNTRTKGQIQETIDFFGYMEPLRERGPSKDGHSNVGWLDVVGTIYDFSDFMQKIVKHARDNPGQWKITKQSCWLDKAKRIPLWPERFPAEELDRILNSPQVGPYIFSSQYELNPIAPGTGLATEEQIKFFPAKFIKELMPRYRRIATTIDLATLDGSNVNGDFCAMVTAGFDGNGRLDVFNIQCDRFNDTQIVDLMFLLNQVYPSNHEFRIQKDQIASGLKTLLRREMEKRRVWLNIKYVPIPTNESKTHRIIRHLQGWFALGLIRFADNIPIACKNELIDEILQFPRGEHDDIIDALADQMHDADGEPNRDSVPRGTEENAAIERNLMGFNPLYVREPEYDSSACYADVTGI